MIDWDWDNNDRTFGEKEHLPESQSKHSKTGLGTIKQRSAGDFWAEGGKRILYSVEIPKDYHPKVAKSQT